MKRSATRSAPRALPPPVESFTSAGGRTFTVAAGEHEERYGDSFWFDVWPISFDEAPAGKLYRSLKYGAGSTGEPRWHATIRELHWSRAPDAPTGIGFDVAAFDTAEEALAAWGRSAEQICDWAEGKPVVGSYGVVRRSEEARVWL